MATYNNRYQSGGNPPPTVPTYNGGAGGQPPRRRQSGWASNLPGVSGNIGTVNTPGAPTHTDAGNYTTEGWASNLPGVNGNMGTINTPGAPTHMDTGPVPPPDGYDPDELAAMITQLFGDQLGQGPRDTTEDEELIRQMMAGQVGGNLADLNARMGGMGFGDSGAAMNLSGDIYQRGARQASEDIMGLRQRSRDDYQDQIAQAAQILFGERELGMSEDFYSQMQEYIASLIDGGEGGGGDATNNPFLSDGQYTAADEAGIIQNILQGGQYASAQVFGGARYVSGREELPDGLVPMGTHDGQEMWVDPETEQMYMVPIEAGMSAQQEPQMVGSHTDVPGYPDQAEKVMSDGPYTYYIGSDGNFYIVQGG
jgi:hypothetical protein